MQISEIKSRLSIAQVLRHYGLEVQANGHLSCPLHEDKKPSMRVYPQTNTVYCFAGGCPSAGHSLDVIDLLMHLEKCSKHEALLKAAALAGELPKLETKPKQEADYQELSHEQRLDILGKRWTQFRHALAHSKPAKSYAAERGLDYTKVFFGYNAGQFYHRKSEQKADLEAWEALGLISKSLVKGKTEQSYAGWAKNCLIFPLKDSLGRTCSFYGRSLTKGHFYLKNRCGLYPNYPHPQSKKIILTESIIDAATLLQIKELEEYSILALYGTNGLTSEHKTALQGLEFLEEVYIMLDGDEAGQKATSQLESDLQHFFRSIEKEKVQVKKVLLPKDTDVNELWVNHQSAELFLELLQGAEKTEVHPKNEVLENPESPINKALQLNIENANDLKFLGRYAAYSIKGSVDLRHLDSLKITLVFEGSGGRKSRQKLDLYEDKSVEKACREATTKIGIQPDLLELDLNLLTDELDKYRAALLKETKSESPIKSEFLVAPQQRAAALEFLKNPALMELLNHKIGESGVVGENKTRLLLYLVAASYKNARPLHALIQGESGSGKTLLLRKIMSLLPENEQFIWTRITACSLYNRGRDLEHKTVAVEDWDGLLEEVQLALRELQSGDVLRSSSTEKNEQGQIVGLDKTTYGPIASLICTTHGQVYEDNMSRCIIVAVDESAEQTARILDYQNRLERGEIDRKTEENNRHFIQTLTQVLQPCEVVNPFAGKINLPPQTQKIRRFNALFNVVVRQVAWLHQFQRKRDALGRVIAEKSDLKAALLLLFDAIVRKVDELHGSLRSFFEKLKALVLKKGEENYRFTRQEVRLALHLSKTSQHRFFSELEELEYIRIVHANRYEGHKYQICYWDDYQAIRTKIQADFEQQLQNTIQGVPQKNGTAQVR